MKCLVTGGAGFIGSHLVEELVRHGHEVRILDNFSTGKSSHLAEVRNKISIIKADVRDTKAVRRAARGVDTIFHLAAIVPVQKFLNEPKECCDINVLGTVSVFESALREKIRTVIYASSCAVYGADRTLPKKESMTITPMSFYAESKRMNERHAWLFHHYFGLNAIGLRFFNVYGPRQDGRSPYSGVISIFMEKFKKKERPIVFGNGRQTRDFVHVQDVVQGMMLAARQKDLGGEVMNIATGKAITINQLIAQLNKQFGTELRPVYRKERSWDVIDSVASISKARKLLGYTSKVALATGLRTL